MENRVFNPAHLQKLSSPERYKILPPFNTLKFMCLRKDDIMIDIGCGTGYFTLPAAQIIGPAGKVIGIDISDVMLDELRRKIDANSTNIELLKSDSPKLPISDQTGTFVLISNVLHEAEDMPVMLKEANRILKPGGRLAIIEWEKRETPMGPPIEHRLHSDEIIALVNDAGFIMTKVSPAGDYHIACTAIKR